MSDTAPVSTRPSAADLLRRGDQPLPGEHVVLHLTGTDQGTTVTVDTPDGRAVYTIERVGGFHEVVRKDTGATMLGGNLGHMLGRILRDARKADDQ